VRPFSGEDSAAARCLAGLLLAVVAFATYENSFDVGFPLDNYAIILEASHVHDATWENVRAIFSHSYWWPKLIDRTYRPLTVLTYLFNYAVLGSAARPASYHGINLALHWLNGLLVFVLAQRIGIALTYAVAAAALFLAHPLATEAVTNIVGRADLLATFSVLAGLLLHIRGRASARPLPWRLALAGLTFLGLLCKENAATVLGCIVLYDALVRPSAAGSDTIGSAARPWSVGTYAWVSLSLLAVWGLRQWVGQGTIPWPTLFTENVLIDQPFVAARLTAIKVLGQSLAQILWPARLCWDYSVNETQVFDWRLGTWEDLQVAATLMAVGTLGILLWRVRRSTTVPLFAVAFFLVTWLPTANLLLLIGWTRADRFLYLPLAGAVWGAAWVAETIAANGRRRGGRWVTRLVPVACAAIVLALGLRAHQRNPDWQDALTICGRDAQSCPDSFRTHQCFAEALMVADPHGNVDRAVAEVERAQRIVEENVPRASTLPPPVVDNLASIYRAKAAEVTAAERPVWVAKSVDALERLTRWQQALDRRYRELAPQYGMLPEEVREIGPPSHYVMLGKGYAELGRHAEAIAALQHAVEMAPGRASTHDALAHSFAAVGDTENAIVSLLRTFLCDAGQQQVWPRLRGLYAALDPGGCAFESTPTGPQLDRSCPRVRAHLCQAMDGLRSAFLAARLLPDADRVAAAARGFGCADGK